LNSSKIFTKRRKNKIKMDSCACSLDSTPVMPVIPIYLQARTTLIDNVNMVTTCYALDIKFLTCGNVNLTYEENGIMCYSNYSTFVLWRG
jgi:hypothetical protein